MLCLRCRRLLWIALVFMGLPLLQGGQLLIYEADQIKYPLELPFFEGRLLRLQVMHGQCIVLCYLINLGKRLEVADQDLKLLPQFGMVSWLTIEVLFRFIGLPVILQFDGFINEPCVFFFQFGIFFFHFHVHLDLVSWICGLCALVLLQFLAQVVQFSVSLVFLFFECLQGFDQLPHFLFSLLREGL